MDAILCLLDYDIPGPSVLEAALGWADRLHKTLIVAHLDEACSPRLVEENVAATESPSDVAALERLKDFAAAQITPAHGYPIRYVIGGGNYRERLDELVMQYEVGLLILGFREAQSLKTGWFGSFARRIIDALPCPTLLLPVNFPRRPIKQVIYATEFAPDHLNAIEVLLGWCQRLEARLQLVHINESIEDHSWALQQMEKIMHTFEEEDVEEQMDYQVIDGEDVAEQLEKHIQATPVDVLAMTAYKKGFWERLLKGSIAQEIMQEVNLPLLLFPEE